MFVGVGAVCDACRVKMVRGEGGGPGSQQR
jgi:hypothetical protein